MNFSPKTAALLVGCVALGGAGLWADLAIRHFDDDPITGSVATVTVTQAPPTSEPAPPGKPLVAGDYTFDILGGSKATVRLEECGPDCLTLTTAPTEANPAGFRQQLSKVDNRYVGQSFSEHGAVCVAGEDAKPADTKYSVNADGTDGLVEVLGQPCGPDTSTVPLKFVLTPAA